MAKPHSSIYNLDCACCFYLQKEALFPDGAFHMADDLLESYVHQAIDAHATQPEVTFA